MMLLRVYSALEEGHANVDDTLGVRVDNEEREDGSEPDVACLREITRLTRESGKAPGAPSHSRSSSGHPVEGAAGGPHDSRHGGASASEKSLEAGERASVLPGVGRSIKARSRRSPARSWGGGGK